MSLILDALRRSEDGGVAASPQPPSPAEQSGGLGKKWLGVVVLACAGLGMAAGWMVRGGSTDPLNTEQVVSPVFRSLSLGDGAATPESLRGDAVPPAPNGGPSPATARTLAADASGLASPHPQLTLWCFAATRSLMRPLPRCAPWRAMAPRWA